MIVKTQEEQDNLIISGSKLREALDFLSGQVKEGVSKKSIDELARNKLKELKVEPAFLDYKPEGALRAFPAAVCVSVNNELVHGIPNESDYIFQKGDVVKIDMGVVYRDMYTDAAFTKIIGEDSPKEIKTLVNATKEALKAGIEASSAGNKVGDIGNAIEEVAKKYGLTIMKELGGHGLGESQHEEPYIPNFGCKGDGETLEENMIIAIEPIFSLGRDETIKLGEDNFTYLTNDDSIGAHFEHTILIKKDRPIYITGEMW